MEKKESKSVTWVMCVVASVTVEVPTKATDDGISKVLSSLLGLREIADEQTKKRFQMNVVTFETIAKIVAPTTPNALQVVLPFQKDSNPPPASAGGKS